ncbi:ATP-grasp domain-containing protein [Ursidibacter arcticus]
MRFLMLCREPRLYSCQRLLSAANQLGHSMDILDPNRFLLKLSQGQFEYYYQQGEGYDKHRPEPIKLDQYDGVIPRFGTTSTEMGSNVLHHFQQQGINVLNSAESFRLARDKWQSLQALVGAGIAVPDSAMAGELYSLNQTVKQFQFPLVIKTLSGSQGVGVMLAEKPTSAVSLLETLKMAKVNCLLQHFIAESTGEDIRAFVIGDKVVASMVRYSASGDFRANIHQGGRAEPISLSTQEQQIAIEATKALGLDVAGVDLIRSQTKTLVLEVNASPGLEMIEKVSQQDIATQMIEHLLQKIA